MRRFPEWLTSEELTALRKFANLLRQSYGNLVLSMRLFGSKARGDYEPYSDLDVLVLVREGDWRLTREICLLSSDVSLEHDVLVSPRVVTRERWGYLEKSGYSIISTSRKGLNMAYLYLLKETNSHGQTRLPDYAES